MVELIRILAILGPGQVGVPLVVHVRSQGSAASGPFSHFLNFCRATSAFL